MSIIAGLTKFDANAYQRTHKTIQSIETQITAYHAQKNTINHLANAFFFSLATLVVKLVWNKVTGTGLKTAVTSSSSVILGLFSLAALGGIFWCLDDGNKKAKSIAGEIKTLCDLTKEKFYGETVEIKADLVTAPEVLESMQKNLRPCFDNTVDINTNYFLIATNELTLQGTTADDFICTSVKIFDNFKEIEATIALWRKYYAELYFADPNSRTTVTMQVIASQCIQGPLMKPLEDETYRYSCRLPTVQYPKSGSIGHQYQTDSKETNLNYFTTPTQFRQHLKEKTKYIDELPKVKLLFPIPSFDERN